MSRIIRPHSETVTLGTVHAGKIIVTDRGFEAFGPSDQYVANFPTMGSARKALFNLNQARSSALSGGSAEEGS